MLHLIHISNKKETIRFILEIQTKNVETHALMTDYPEFWEAIREYAQNKLNQLIELDDRKR